MKIEQTGEIGFCYGVRRAIGILERVAGERGGVESLGAVVHNQQVLQRLAAKGVQVIKGLDDIRGNVVAIASHGTTPDVEAEMQARHIDVVDTTCPFVHRVQIAARRLCRSGFFTVIFGDAGHTEVRGVLGWAEGKGLATLDETAVARLEPVPRRLGVLSQTTQVPADFNRFVKGLIDLALVRDAELRIFDTICHDLRRRQAEALALAQRVELMLVIGGRGSSNSNHLAALCAQATQTQLLETAAEIDPAWFRGVSQVGVASGASTAAEDIDQVIARLEAL